MKTKQLIYLSTFAFAITLSGCKKDVPEPEPPVTTLLPTTYSNGVFITNEGPYGSQCLRWSQVTAATTLILNQALFHLKVGLNIPALDNLLSPLIRLLSGLNSGNSPNSRIDFCQLRLLRSPYSTNECSWTKLNVFPATNSRSNADEKT